MTLCVITLNIPSYEPTLPIMQKGPQMRAFPSYEIDID